MTDETHHEDTDPADWLRHATGTARARAADIERRLGIDPHHDPKESNA